MSTGGINNKHDLMIDNCKVTARGNIFDQRYLKKKWGNALHLISSSQISPVRKINIKKSKKEVFIIIIVIIILFAEVM